MLSTIPAFFFLTPELTIPALSCSLHRQSEKFPFKSTSIGNNSTLIDAPKNLALHPTAVQTVEAGCSPFRTQSSSREFGEGDAAISSVGVGVSSPFNRLSSLKRPSSLAALPG